MPQGIFTANGCTAPSERGEINTLRSFVNAFTIRDMKSAREQREANTVEGSAIQLKTQLRHAWRADTRSERNYPWSRPCRAIMCTGLGTSLSFGSGQVPV